MGKIIAVANQKGGVGKTTTAVNTAASLIKHGQKVLLVDLDPQGNATMGSGVDKQTLSLTIGDVLLGSASFKDIVQDTEAGYQLLPGNHDVTIAEVKLLDMPHYQKQLRHSLQPIKSQYDYILIDCPPALNSLTLNALTAADSVLMPMQCEYYSLEGLTALLSTIEQLCASLNPDLHLEGILRTMFDARNRLTGEISEQLFKHFGEQVYYTVIPRNVRLAEAPSHGLSIWHYDKTSQGARAYLLLAGELMQRDKARTVAQKLEQASSPSNLNKPSSRGLTTEIIKEETI